MRRFIPYSAGALVAAALAMHLSSSGCAEGSVEFATGGGGTTNVSTTTGGSGGTGGGSGGSSLCAEDCSAITTPQCLQSVCNDGTYQGVVGTCVVVPSEAGETCDDEVFCTVDDTCDGNGVCMGGP